MERKRHYMYALLFLAETIEAEKLAMAPARVATTLAVPRASLLVVDLSFAPKPAGGRSPQRLRAALAADPLVHDADYHLAVEEDSKACQCPEAGKNFYIEDMKHVPVGVCLCERNRKYIVRGTCDRI